MLSGLSTTFLTGRLGNPAYSWLIQSIQIQCRKATNLSRQVNVQPSSSLTQIRLIRPAANRAAVIGGWHKWPPVAIRNAVNRMHRYAIIGNATCGPLRPVHCQGPFAAVYCIPKRDFWGIRPRDQDVERIAPEAPTVIFIKIILLLACLDPRLSAGQSSRCRDDYCLWKYRPGHTVQLHQDRHGELQERWKSKGNSVPENSISAAPGFCRAILHAVYGIAISAYAPTSTLWISAQLMEPAFLAPQAAILS
jgi:hypothetical protein